MEVEPTFPSVGFAGCLFAHSQMKLSCPDQLFLPMRCMQHWALKRGNSCLTYYLFPLLSSLWGQGFAFTLFFAILISSVDLSFSITGCLCWGDVPDEHFPEERKRGGCVLEAQDVSDEAENTVIVVAVHAMHCTASLEALIHGIDRRLTSPPCQELCCSPATSTTLADIG